MRRFLRPWWLVSHVPALVVSRDEAIPVLNNVVVAPVTSTTRPIPTCVPIGSDEGVS